MVLANHRREVASSKINIREDRVTVVGCLRTNQRLDPLVSSMAGKVRQNVKEKVAVDTKIQYPLC